MFEEINEKAVRMMAQSEKKDSILNYIVVETGKLIGNGSVVSILLLDNNGLLRNGYSPQLPQDYLKAIDGIKPDPNVGTCAAAAATGEIVITPDFYADIKWAELKHLPMSIGFSGAWSVPIKSQNGKVLGTFGTYLKNTKHPSPYEISGTVLLAKTTAMILEKAS
jgi:GAF domain-containing protein